MNEWIEKEFLTFRTGNFCSSCSLVMLIDRLLVMKKLVKYPGVLPIETIFGNPVRTRRAHGIDAMFLSVFYFIVVVTNCLDYLPIIGHTIKL